MVCRILEARIFVWVWCCWVVVIFPIILLVGFILICLLLVGLLLLLIRFILILILLLFVSILIIILLFSLLQHYQHIHHHPLILIFIMELLKFFRIYSCNVDTIRINLLQKFFSWYTNCIPILDFCSFPILMTCCITSGVIVSSV